jgi:hypothetical protein
MKKCLFEKDFYVSSPDEAMYVLFFYVLGLDIQFAKDSFATGTSPWDAIKNFLESKAVSWTPSLLRPWIPCEFGPNMRENCFHCFAKLAAQTLFATEPQNVEHALIVVSDSMGRALKNDYPTVIVNGARVRLIARAVRFLAHCLERTHFLLVTFTCDVVPYPLLEEKCQISIPFNSPANPPEIAQLLHDLKVLLKVKNYQKRIALLTPFFRPSWPMSKSKQPKNCPTPPHLLTEYVYNLYKALLDFGQKRQLTIFDFYHQLDNPAFYVQNDIHLNYRGQSELRALVKKIT